MSSLGTIVALTNLTGEMCFILRWRFIRQNCDLDRVHEALSSILATLTKPSFLAVLFRPMFIGGYPNPIDDLLVDPNVLNAVLERLYSSGSVRLSPQAFEKLVEMAMVVFKFQVMSALDVRAVTRNHLSEMYCIAEQAQSKTAMSGIKALWSKLDVAFSEMKEGDCSMLRMRTLAFLQEKRTFVSVLIGQGMQNDDGTLNYDLKCTEGIGKNYKPPGTITTFNVSGKAVRVECFNPLEVVEGSDSPPEGSDGVEFAEKNMGMDIFLEAEQSRILEGSMNWEEEYQELDSAARFEHENELSAHPDRPFTVVVPQTPHKSLATVEQEVLGTKAGESSSSSSTTGSSSSSSSSYSSKSSSSSTSSSGSSSYSSTSSSGHSSSSTTTSSGSSSSSSYSNNDNSLGSFPSRTKDGRSLSQGSSARPKIVHGPPASFYTQEDLKSNISSSPEDKSEWIRKALSSLNVAESDLPNVEMLNGNGRSVTLAGTKPASERSRASSAASNNLRATHAGKSTKGTQPEKKESYFSSSSSSSSSSTSATSSSYSSYSTSSYSSGSSKSDKSPKPKRRDSTDELLASLERISKPIAHRGNEDDSNVDDLMMLLDEQHKGDEAHEDDAGVDSPLDGLLADALPSTQELLNSLDAFGNTDSDDTPSKPLPKLVREESFRMSEAMRDGEGDDEASMSSGSDDLNGLEGLVSKGIDSVEVVVKDSSVSGESTSSEEKKTEKTKDSMMGSFPSVKGIDLSQLDGIGEDLITDEPSIPIEDSASLLQALDELNDLDNL